MQFIALGHYARVGKDTFADYIQQAVWERDPSFPIIKMSFAYKLKQICHELYGWAGLREPEFYETPEGAALREVVLPKIGLSPRGCWIKVGTNAIREQVYPNTWRDLLLNTDFKAKVGIITDLRFWDEAEGVEEFNGHRCKVVRPGYGPGNNKPDRELLDYRRWNNTVGETGSLSELRKWADKYALWILGQAPEPNRPLYEQELAWKVEVIT